MTEPKEEDKKGDGQPEQIENVVNFVHKSPIMRIAIYGMSKLINTRLSDEALEVCLEMIELGVHPKALADVVLHLMEVKERYENKPHQ